MKKSVPDRQCTDGLREAAVEQVVDGGRAIKLVAHARSRGLLRSWSGTRSAGFAVLLLQEAIREHKFGVAEAGLIVAMQKLQPHEATNAGG